MSNILFCHEYATKCVIINGIKNLFTPTIAWKLQDLQDRGYLDQI
jgi:hypothetical protein